MHVCVNMLYIYKILYSWPVPLNKIKINYNIIIYKWLSIWFNIIILLLLLILHRIAL